MTNWGLQYLNFPAAHTLEGNCSALAKKILWEQYRKTMPSFLQVARMVKQGKDLPFSELDRPKDGCLVLCGNNVHPVRHVGVYSKMVDRVIHALPEAGCVRVQPVWRLKLEWPLVTFWSVNT